MTKTLISSVLGAALSIAASGAYAFSGAPAVAENDYTAMAAHQKTWEYQALSKQNLLDNAVPISEGFRVMAHNAFNSSAYSSIVYADPNHTLSITEQLDTGVRYLELDAHWITQTKEIPFSKALLLCHAQSSHLGCSGLERYLKDAVAEIGDWLRKNPREVLGIMIQNEVEGQTSEVVAAFSSIHDLIYKAAPRNDTQSIYTAVKTLTEETILKAGKQVFVMSSISGAFTPYTYSGSFNGMGDPKDFANVSEADCIADVSKQKTHHRLFDDGTVLGGLFDGGGRINDAMASKAGRCGASVLAPDKLTIGDSRLKASIWSWAENEPSGGATQDCGFVRDNGRYYDGSCSGEASYYACKSDATNWKVTAASGDWGNGDAQCKSEFGASYSFAMPTNSQQNEWLKVALNGKAHAWVNYSDKADEGIWLTSAHKQDYRDGIADLGKLKVGAAYEFYMKTVNGSCELEWEGGNTGSATRNAKFDCASKGDPMIFIPDAAPNTTGGKTSIHGVIKTQVSGYLCGLEWSGNIGNNEMNAHFDCSGEADPITIISDSDGTSANVRITSDNNCGLQWAGGDADDNERNAKFDCDPSWDAMRLYGVNAMGDQMMDYSAGESAKPIAGNMGGMNATPDAIVRWSSDYSYVFQGDKYWAIYHSDLRTTSKKSIKGNWGGVMGSDSFWTSGIDAAVEWNSDVVYFFKGDKYLKMFKSGEQTPDGTRSIASGWGMTGNYSNFASGIDAAVNWGNDVYFFKGNNFVRHDIAIDKPELGPLPIVNSIDGWGKLNVPVGAAVNTGSKKLFLLK